LCFHSLRKSVNATSMISAARASVSFCGNEAPSICAAVRTMKRCGPFLRRSTRHRPRHRAIDDV
jgi:hypothetical protein